MTPHRSHARGTLVIDRQFAGIGRLRRASGTVDPREYQQINDLLTTLFRRRRLDHLAAIRDGLAHPLDLLIQVQRRGLDSLDDLPLPQDLKPIADAWESWVAGTRRPNTRRMYAQAWRYLLRHLPDQATLGDLPAALLALRAEQRDKAPTFNRTRASVQAFVSFTAGTKHPAYVALEGIGKLTEATERREGLTIGQAIAIRHALAPEAGAIWWQLVTTGMRVGELYMEQGATWSTNDTTVMVAGTKTRNASRVLPRLADLVAPSLPLRRLRGLLREHGVTPHVARYTFKVFAEDAGLPSNRVEQYMGRSPRGMSGLYSRVELASWVAQDRPLLLAYLAAAEQRATTDRRAGLRRA